MLLGVLGAALAGTAVWAVVVFSKPPPRLGDGENVSPTPLTGEQVRILAMERIQQAVGAQMRVYIDTGRFSDDPSVTGGDASVEVCEEEKVVVLVAIAVDGSVFGLKARGQDPPSAGEAAFSHYTEDPPCDVSEGPETWPGGYHVSRQGLKKGEELVEIPLS